MTKRDDGGPAYPIMWDYAENETGMSLRDYLASHADLGGMEFPSAAAMAEFMGEDLPKTDLEVIAMSARAIAKIRYMFADAMLEERNK